jgi:hypothetical protein
LSVPTFCRHNRLLHHCPICARDQEVELAPALSSSAPRTELGQESRRGRATGAGSGVRQRHGGSGGGRKAGGSIVQVRRLQRGADDGYRSPLAPGLRSSAEAARLAEELAFAAGRLQALRERPPGLYAEVAAAGDVEERAWLAFLIAYLCPLDEADPFAAVREVRTRWDALDLPDDRGIPCMGPASWLAGGRVHRRSKLDPGASVRANLRKAGAARATPRCAL